MLGADMTRMDAFTLSLLTNDEVLAVNQHSANNRPLSDRGGLVAWTADVPGSPDRYLALFNATDAEARVGARLADIGVGGRASVRDLWTHTEIGASGPEFSALLPAHGAGLYRVSRMP